MQKPHVLITYRFMTDLASFMPPTHFPPHTWIILKQIPDIIAFHL